MNQEKEDWTTPEDLTQPQQRFSNTEVIKGKKYMLNLFLATEEAA